MIKVIYDKGLRPIILGFSIWLMIVLGAWPVSFFSLNYVQLLILSAPLFVIPLSLKKNKPLQVQNWMTLLFALLIVFSFWLEKGFLAALSVLPWMLFSFFLLLEEIKILRRIDHLTGKESSRLAAFTYLLIGALWLMADRIDFQPLGFGPTIVLLTVAHFHFAGFLLLMITSWIFPFYPIKMMKRVSLFVIMGVPLVAIGITTTHLNFTHWIETISVIVMVAGGMAISTMHLILGWRYKKDNFGFLWMIGGLALISGMALALMYGLRNIVIVPFLTIPWMYAVHGTLNAIGFALPTVLGWYLFYEKEKRSTSALS